MRAVKLPTDGQLWYRTEFLKSDEWKATSKTVKEKIGNRCNLCGTRESVLCTHHIYYDYSDLCDPRYLICLCKECHHVTHEMIDDFKSLPKKDRVVMYYEDSHNLAMKYLSMYYFGSYLKHTDSYSFFDKKYLRTLRRFIGIQLSWLAPNLLIYHDGGVREKRGFPLEGQMMAVEKPIKEMVAHYVWHIRYTYTNVSDKQLMKHFKLGKKAWETVLTLEKNNRKRYKNMKALDFTNVQATQGGEFARPTAGGYVIGIVNVEDVPEREYLKITYDIAEGEFKNYYYDMKQRTGYDLPVMYKSYKDKALGFFKAFLDAVTDSNPGYKWNNDERTLCRKLVGCVLREEEYRNRDGEIKVSLKPDVFYPAADIRAGKFEVLDRKCLNDARYDKYVDSRINANTANAPLTSAQSTADDMVIFSEDGVPF